MNNELPEMRVLLMDDEQASRETLRRLFEQAELDVDVAGTVEDALRALRAAPGRPLVLLNAHADAEASVRFMEALDTDPPLRARCVVVDIARAAGNVGTQPAHGANRNIERPLTPRELLELVHEYVEHVGA